jgi:hypothetical protein
LIAEEDRAKEELKKEEEKNEKKFEFTSPKTNEVVAHKFDNERFLLLSTNTFIL